jgi:hypothetical protein
MDHNLPSGDGVPDGTFGFPHEDGSFTLIRRCDICYAAVIETHDADYQMHLEWHERSGTNLPPTA